jgi:hypothetical protein
MRLTNRVKALEDVCGGGPDGPVTVVLIDPTPDFPAGRRDRTDAAGRPVVEIVSGPGDDAAGVVATPTAPLPAGPCKIVAGADPIDLV